MVVLVQIAVFHIQLCFLTAYSNYVVVAALTKWHHINVLLHILKQVVTVYVFFLQTSCSFG